MFCQNCGKQLPDGAKFCTNCGAQQTVSSPAAAPAAPRHAAPETFSYQPVQDAGSTYTSTSGAPADVPADGPDDSISVGLIILSFIIPLFGIIYWPVKAKTRPRCAKICGIVSIVSWIFGFVVAQIG